MPATTTPTTTWTTQPSGTVRPATAGFAPGETRGRVFARTWTAPDGTMRMFAAAYGPSPASPLSLVPIAVRWTVWDAAGHVITPPSHRTILIPAVVCPKNLVAKTDARDMGLFALLAANSAA